MTFLQKIQKKRIEKKNEKDRKKLDRAIEKYSRTNCKKAELDKKLLEQEMESWKSNKIKENTIKTKAIIAILLGVIMLLASLLIDIYFSIHGSQEVVKIFLNPLLNIFNIVISIIIGIGVSTIVLDFFSYVQYTRDRLKKIVVDKSFIKELSDDEKKNIIFKAEESLYFKDGKILPNSLYADVKKKIIPLLDSCYFSEFSVTISCDVDEKEGVIKKEILKNVKIISNENDTEFKIPFSVYLRQPDCGEVMQAYEIVSCIFQGENITESFKMAQEHIKVDDKVSDKDDTKISANYQFKLKKGENTIEIKSRTKVPINDNVYTHYLTLPCMKFTSTFIMNTENYSVSGYGFALENTRDSGNDKDNVNYYRIGKSLTISINEWTLPGEGSMFIINREDENFIDMNS